jgi:hypothetical protein
MLDDGYIVASLRIDSVLNRPPLPHGKPFPRNTLKRQELAARNLIAEATPRLGLR